MFIGYCDKLEQWDIYLENDYIYFKGKSKKEKLKLSKLFENQGISYNEVNETIVINYDGYEFKIASEKMPKLLNALLSNIKE